MPIREFRVKTTQHAAMAEPVISPGESLSLWDRFLAFRDRVYSSPRFHALAPRLPIFRSVALSRSRQVFDICAGFTYTQTLLACIELRLLELVRDHPLSALQVAKETGLRLESVERLLDAAVSLRILGKRSGDRYGLGALGGPILAQPSVTRMARHNALLYQDLIRPVELLNRPPGGPTAVGAFFPYAETASPDRIEGDRATTYSALMADTIAPIAEDVIASGGLDGCRTLLDVGGGNGQFLLEAGTRLPSLEQLRLFDLPSVTQVAAARFERHQLASKFAAFSGDFHDAELPGGNDAITLIRVLLDHDDVRALALLRKAKAALRPGGRLIVAEPMKGVPGSADRTADVYFSFYLFAMGRGRSRPVAKLSEMMKSAGFSGVTRLREAYPVFASVLIGKA